MDAESARELFDANARTYDRVNSIVSLGLDSRWHEWAAAQATACPDARVLDAFAGSGEVGLRAAGRGAKVTLADVSSEMLDVARERARDLGLDVSTVEVDLTAHDLRLPGAPFDAAIAMWGLRYVEDPTRVLCSIGAQLADGGRLVVVDFVEPEPGIVPRLAAVYFFRILPKIASVLARRGELYTQLTATTHRMGRAERLKAIVHDAGFEIVETRVMGFGLVLGLVAARRQRSRRA